jgi:diaminohydroxyphosphoribosylaminopyrimidine deaminase/5-amino-6-(5-phosphoribosylamino)uracil reductase
MKDHYMRRAIELAKGGSGFVNPDPLAGAVVVGNDEIVGQGYYKGYKMQSAFLEALKNIKVNNEGLELYINIEPDINSFMDEGILEEAIRKGIRKVYVGMLNPCPEYKGKTLKAMKQSGIEIIEGVLQDECFGLNEIYAHYITNLTPFVFVKWAMTLDGKLASRTGDSKWISSEESLKFVHHLRQRVAAIMVGENTVNIDNPLLTTRLEGTEISNPLRVILSKYGNIRNDANILKTDDSMKTLIIASVNIPGEREELFNKAGAEVLKLEERDKRIDFRDIISALGRKGIDSLYIEGGSEVLASAFESRVINKVYAAVAPKIIGGRNAVTPVGGQGIEKMRDAIVLKRVSHEIIGEDVIIKGYIE